MSAINVTKGVFNDEYLKWICGFANVQGCAVKNVPMFQKYIRSFCNFLFLKNPLSNFNNPHSISPLFPYFSMNKRIKENYNSIGNVVGIETT